MKKLSPAGKRVPKRERSRSDSRSKSPGFSFPRSPRFGIGKVKLSSKKSGSKSPVYKERAVQIPYQFGVMTASCMKVMDKFTKTHVVEMMLSYLPPNVAL